MSKNAKMGEDMYNVEKYTDKELYDILDLVNPSDRELEARIFHLVKKYKNMDTTSGNKLAFFFENIYDRFFEIEEPENTEEGFNEKNQVVETQPITLNSVSPNNANNKIATTQFEYTKDYINPLLKQTISRVISIDSQYRSAKQTTLSTQFSFNLSEPLKNVVSISMNSIQIPKTWYTISKSYGSNFFYIKGNSPGINDGNHDYQITVTPGNYTQQQLVDTLNTSITNIKAKNTDVSFGNTNIFYNVNTCKATITASIENIYNQTDYKLNFNTFSYPKVDRDENIGIYQTIPGILGFENTNYAIGSVVSNSDLSGTGHPSGTINYNGNGENVIGDSYYGYTDMSDTKHIFYLKSSNNSFTIMNYNGYDTTMYRNQNSTDLDYIKNNSYNTFVIKSSLNTDMSYNRFQIVDDFNTQIQKSPFLLSNYSGINRRYISDISNTNYGFSYFEFLLRLNKKTTTNAENMQTIAIFPHDHTIWLGANSCFHFDSSLNELSNIKATVQTPTSIYTINDNNSGTFFMVKCDARGYYYGSLHNYSERDFSKNDIPVKIKTGDYLLSEYLNEINYGLKRADTTNNNIFDPTPTQDNPVTNITGFYINAASEYKLRMRFYIKKQFTVDAYTFHCEEGDFFYNKGFYKYQDYDISKQTNGLCELISEFVLDSDVNNINGFNILFRLKPNIISSDTSFGNYYADPFHISFNQSYINERYPTRSNNFSNTELTDIILYSIQNWEDPILHVKPLAKCTFGIASKNSTSVSNTIKWKIDLSGINVSLREKDYSVVFNNNSGPSNAWREFLYLDNSYNLSNSSAINIYTNIFDVSYVQITGKERIGKNIITVNQNVNDSITLQASLPGVYDSTGYNSINITIDPAEYNVNSLIDEIRRKLVIKMPGSDIYKYQAGYDKNGKQIEYIVMRINHNKVFTTNDYRLVFYDPFSFVRCYVGATSVRNTTWDTTIGWILGFRQSTEYPLGTNYITTDINDPTVTYYSTTTSLYTYNTAENIMTIIGDTTVSVNIYNYFMIILDDYTQNHLNDGLITIIPSESDINPPMYVNNTTIQCNPSTSSQMFSGTTIDDSLNKATQNKIYAANQQLAAQTQRRNYYSPGPFVQDIFALIPLNTSSVTPGSVFVDTGSGLGKQNRIYFGPVNISRMTISLVNDRGDVVDLNGSDWSCSIQCDHLYQQHSL